MTQKKFLVTGATGDTGGYTVEQLVEREHAVRALARREDDRLTRVVFEFEITKSVLSRNTECLVDSRRLQALSSTNVPQRGPCFHSNPAC